MDIFIKKITFFILLLLVVLTGTLLINKLILNYLYDKEAKLPKETKWLAIGDSHITNAINPEKYNWIQNRAHSGERLLYNFEKIKFYIDNNPNVELVILGYWNSTLSYDMDWVRFGKDAKYRYESYLPLMFYNNSDTQYLNVPKNKSLYYENYLGYKFGYPSPSTRLTVKNFLTFNQDLEMRGGFLNRKNKYSREVENLNIKKDSIKMVIDSLPLKNLEDIIKYLKDRNVKLVFYNTPNTEEFFAPFNDYNIRLSDSIISSYVDNKSVWYINHSKFYLPDSLFNDKHHLNTFGANYMTPILVDSINKLVYFKK